MVSFWQKGNPSPWMSHGVARAGKGLKDDDYYYYYYDTETIRVEKSVVKMLPVRVAPSVVSEFGFLFVFGCSFQ